MTRDDDRVYAILPPPALETFREITGVGDAGLEARFDGWSKLALLTDDVVYLFPRRGRDDALRFDAEACETLGTLGVTSVPRVVGSWDELGIAGPCIGFERRHGRQWSDIEADVSLADVRTMLRSLGRVIATWHRLDVHALPGTLRRPAAFDPKPTLSALLSTSFADVVAEAARYFGAGDRTRASWCARVEEVVGLADVFVHGDVCENQLIVDELNEVHTVIDWDTAGVAHPLHDFDLGEWGFGIYEWEPHFAELRATMWDAYVGERVPARMPGTEAINLVFALAEFVYFARHRDAGTLDAWRGRRLANTAAALAALT